MKINKNCYVLYCQHYKIEQLMNRLNTKEDIFAFIPRMETYRRDVDHLVLTNMFPGYLFVLTKRSRNEFRDFLVNLGDEKSGLIKELKKDDVSSLTKDEIHLFENLLNQQGILKMSYGKRIDGQSVALEGPLVHYSNEIRKVDFYRRQAYLNIQFLNRNIICGFTVDRKAE